MNTKNLIVRTTVTFAALTLAGVCMAVGARSLANAVDQNILIAIGAAMFAAALAFFLIRVFSLVEK
jgi:hypothetical protein